MSYWHQMRAVLAVRPEDRARDRPRLAACSAATSSTPASPSRRSTSTPRAASTTSPTSRSSTRRCPPASRSTRCARSRSSSTCRSPSSRPASRDLARARRPRTCSCRCRIAACASAGRSGGAITCFTLGHKFMLPWRHKPIPEHHWELGYPYHRAQDHARDREAPRRRVARLHPREPVPLHVAAAPPRLTSLRP